MTYKACIRFAPVFTAERLTRGVKPERTLYDRGSLRFLPKHSHVPLICDHEDDQEIGSVHELVPWEDIDGPWIVARATVTDPPPWLRRGTKASFTFSSLCRSEIFRELHGVDLVRSAIVKEVSILSPSKKPAEALAEVVLLERTLLAEDASNRAVAGEVIYGDGAPIRRYFGGAVLAVGGRALRTSSGLPLRREGHDYIVDRADGSQVIYHGREGYREALRDGEVA